MRCLTSPLLALSLAVVPSCGEPETTPLDTEVGERLSVFIPSPDATLAGQTYSGYTTSERSVVKTDAGWPAIWSKIHEGQSPEPQLVQPNFATEDAIIAAMGEKNSGGYSITIDSVTRHARGAIVYVTENSPAATCITAAVITQPVHAVRAPKATGTYQWRERSLETNC